MTHSNHNCLTVIICTTIYTRINPGNSPEQAFSQDLKFFIRPDFVPIERPAEEHARCFPVDFMSAKVSKRFPNLLKKTLFIQLFILIFSERWSSTGLPDFHLAKRAGHESVVLCQDINGFV